MTDSAELPAGLSDAPEAEIELHDVSERHGGRHDAPVLDLNARWRIASDGTLQWILQVRRGKGWAGRRFHVERDALLRSIRELCGEVDRGALPVIAAWPGMYRPDFAGCRFPVRGHDASPPGA